MNRLIAILAVLLSVASAPSAHAQAQEFNVTAPVKVTLGGSLQADY